MRYVLTLGVSLFVLATAAEAQKPPLLPEKDVAALGNEVSGGTAKRNLEGIARFHRQRGAKGFHEAAGLVGGRVRGCGMSGVGGFEVSAGGKNFFGEARIRAGLGAGVWEP